MPIEFDGTPKHLEFDSSECPANLFAGGGTASVWLNLASWGGDGGNGLARIFNKNSGWRIYTRNPIKTLSFRHPFSGTNLTATAPTNAFDAFGIWKLFTVTYDNTSASNEPLFYIDGESVTVTMEDVPTGTANDDSAMDMRIGDSFLNIRYFDGMLADMRLYNRILSPKEIKEIYIQKGQDFNVKDLELWLRVNEKPASQAIGTGEKNKINYR